MSDAPDSTDDPDDEDEDLAPRPRPGWRTRAPQGAAVGAAALFAGVLRAAVGAVGLFAAVLYLPIQPATPILAGVSILMMVTGCASTWRAVAQVPRLRRVAWVLMGGCGSAIALTLVLTWVLGAGALGPFARLKAERAGAPPITFQPAP